MVVMVCGQATREVLFVHPVLDQSPLHLHHPHVNAFAPHGRLVLVLILRPEWLHLLVY